MLRGWHYEPRECERTLAVLTRWQSRVCGRTSSGSYRRSRMQRRALRMACSIFEQSYIMRYLKNCIMYHIIFYEISSRHVATRVPCAFRNHKCARRT